MALRSPTLGSSPPKKLPPRLTVPPLPPRIHRHLALAFTDDGLRLHPLSAASDDAGVLIRWGLHGSLEVCERDKAPTEDDRVELGGVLGIVRLWEAAYLLVFLPPSKPPTKLFPNEETFGPDHQSAHEVCTLADVYAVPLELERAKRQLEYIKSVITKREDALAASQTVPKSRLNSFLNLPWASAGVKPAVEGSDDDEGSDSDSEDEDSEGERRRRRSSAAAPEADETPPAMPPQTLSASPGKGQKSPLVLGWGRFAPRLGTPKKVAGRLVDSFRGSKGKGAAEESETDEEQELSDLSGRPSAEHATPRVLAGGPDVGYVPIPPPEADGLPLAVEPPSRNSSPSPPPGGAALHQAMETRILKSITRELGSGEFFYSFDYDLSHSLQHKRRRLTHHTTSQQLLEKLFDVQPTPSAAFFDESPDQSHLLSPRNGSVRSGASSPGGSDIVEPDIHMPLWRRFDRRFFWNEYMTSDFVELGLHAYVLPISQGWVQASTFNAPIPPSPTDDGDTPPPVPVDIVLISRRSRERAGMRYQRRGIDDEGHVANFVETEMMVRAKVGGQVSIFGFVQIRGSIPLKWSQTPWSMKPPPVLDLPVDQTYDMANRHFDDLRMRYGPTTIVNLSEQTGKEGVVTKAYEELVKGLERSDLTYVPFDFHAKCHGMKWDNITELIDELDFNAMGFLWSLQGEIVEEQQGVLRANCIDCLDRTNVVQSAIARHVITRMLLQLGIILEPSKCNFDAVFNDIWANNGDMISLCYAHTFALKGDFVRTGKRDIAGMLNDGVNSLSRMYYGAVSDFFTQAVISFMLGHRGLDVFNDFTESGATQKPKDSQVQKEVQEEESDGEGS